jgi:hypothetical protein
MISGPAAEWLSQRRADLNARFERARRRFPRLDPSVFAAELEVLLPALAEPAPGSDDLLSATFDLVLLHVGRDAFASRPSLRVLIAEAFPKIRALLLQRPSSLPAALSNAVEAQGPRGLEFARAISAIAPGLGPDDLLNAGALLAWRLGDVRLRDAALAASSELPARAVLVGLDLSDWPDAAAPFAQAALLGDGWSHPRSRVKAETLAGLGAASPQRIEELSTKLRSPPPAPLSRWTVSARIGDFSGFGGSFDTPPEVLDGGSRHHLFVRVGNTVYRVEADVFGWACAREAPVDLGVRVTSESGPLVRRLFSRLTSRATDRLLPDGTLEIGSERATLAGLDGATTFTIQASLVAAGHPDSHRIRIAAPVHEPL